MLRLEQYVKDQLQTNTEQEDRVSCVHKKTWFRTNITDTTLAKILRYLSDAQVVEALITGKMDIPNNVNDTTALILDESTRLGTKVNNGDKVTVSPKYPKHYWGQTRKKMNSSTSLIHFRYSKVTTTFDSISILQLVKFLQDQEIYVCTY